MVYLLGKVGAFFDQLVASGHRAGVRLAGGGFGLALWFVMFFFW